MTTVAVCQDSPRGFPTPEVPGVDIIEVEGLCVNPRQVMPLVAEEETQLVFLIHRREVNLGAVQAVARQLGFDPLGLGIIDLGSIAGLEGFSIAMAGTIARMAGYPGSVPEQLKLLPAQRNTRRSLLSLGAPVYVGAPKIAPDGCVAGDGCKHCVTQCPVGALEWSGGTITYDVNACVACGICVTACPTGAIHNPVASPGAIEAEIRAVIAQSGGSIGIRYRCRDSIVAGEPGWHLVEVPCTGMITVGWILAPLLLGATDVDAVECDTGGCRLGNGDRLAAVMRDAALIREVHWTGAPNAVQTPEPGWLANGSTGQAVAASMASGLEVIIDLETADVGMVDIQPSTCTACEMCAQVCPTGALESAVDGTGVHIWFDPRVCVGCSQCVGTCPELASGAIKMSRRLDGAEWALGRREVRHEPTPACEVCGRPVAPAAMLNRIQEMLGDDGREAMSLIGRRCVNCRGR